MTKKGLNTWSSKQVIRESKNLVKWNPILAIQWMQDEKQNIQSEEIKLFWTKTAKEINNTIDKIEKSATFNHTEYWGDKNILSQRIKIE